MSGGHFGYEQENTAIAFEGAWRDAEINALFYDLFVGPADLDDSSVRGGLANALDYWLAADWTEERYREAVARFKAKWLCRTPQQRVDFYTQKLQEVCDRYKAELKVMR